MVNAIFCAHGKLACAMLESVQMVYGDARVEAVEFVPGENAGDIVAKLEKLVSIHNQDEWLIAVDLQCGSPWNAAAMLAMRNPRLRVISGLSLPLALDLVKFLHGLREFTHPKINIINKCKEGRGENDVYVLMYRY